MGLIFSSAVLMVIALSERWEAQKNFHFRIRVWMRPQRGAQKVPITYRFSIFTSFALFENARLLRCLSYSFYHTHFISYSFYHTYTSTHFILMLYSFYAHFYTHFILIFSAAFLAFHRRMRSYCCCCLLHLHYYTRIRSRRHICISYIKICAFSAGTEEITNYTQPVNEKFKI